MNRKNIIFGSICLLFLIAGVIGGQLLSGQSSPNWIKFLTLVSSLATCVAAIAAWKAAEIAKQQTAQNSTSMRWQLYKTHWDSFNAWLDGVEREMAVEFFGRTSLYDSLFPSNRRGEEFSAVGSDIFLIWYDLFCEINNAVSAYEEPNRAEIEEWAKGYFDLTSSMRFNYKNWQSDQLWLGGVAPTGITEKNYDRVTADAEIILRGLAEFALRDDCPGGKGVSEPFKAGFNYFYISVTNGGWRQHEFRAA